MNSDAAGVRSDAPPRPSPRGSVHGRGWRWGQLLALLGLTGFAVSQPLLAVVGDEPTLFTVAGVGGRGVVAVALLVALLPPLVLWAVVVLAGRVDDRAGDAAFVVLAASLVGLTAIQWAKTVGGIELGPVLALVAIVAAVAFGIGLVRAPAVGLWTRCTAILPVVAVLLLLVSSPTGELLHARSQAPSAGATPPGADPPASVVFVMLDELPLRTILGADGTIDEVRFPNLASLADGATWYRDYTAMANGTLQSVPSILSGRLPTGGPPLWTSYPDTLFSLLAPTHELDVIESVTQLCGFTTCGVDGAAPVDGRGVRSVLSQVAAVWADRVELGPIPPPDVDQFAAAAEPLDPEAAGVGSAVLADEHGAEPAVVVDFLDALRTDPSDPPSLAYLHLLLPHQPWVRYPDGRTTRGASVADFAIGGGEATEWDMSLLAQSHAYQAMYTDRIVGQVVDRLREAGTYDDTLIVVTADHGVQFERDDFPNLRKASGATMDRVAFVPLIVKAPGQATGRVDDSNLVGVDLLPTVADELGIEVPWEVDGFPAGAPGIAARGATKTFYDFGDVFGREVLDVIEFDAAVDRPTAAGRRVASVGADDHSLAGLLRPIEAARFLGASVADLDVHPGDASVTVEWVPQLRQAETVPQLARLVGDAPDLAPGRVVLLVADGVVQSGSPVGEDGSLAFYVPPELTRRAGLEVGALLVDGDRVHRLAVEEA